jgi:hypothetical protein
VWWFDVAVLALAHSQVLFLRCSPPIMFVSVLSPFPSLDIFLILSWTGLPFNGLRVISSLTKMSLV